MLLSIQNLKAQIKLYPGNKLHFGPVWWATYQGGVSNSFFNGGVSFNCYPASSGFTFRNEPLLISGKIYNQPAIVPQWKYSLLLGTMNYPLWRIFTREIYTLNGAVYAISDTTLKSNFQQLNGDSIISKISQMKSYSYDYNISSIGAIDSTHTDSIPPSVSSNGQLGFKAQELIQLYPELVHIDSLTGVYLINYTGLIPLLTEAIKVQETRIKELENSVQLLLNR
jgi:hypothetical protein